MLWLHCISFCCTVRLWNINITGIEWSLQAFVTMRAQQRFSLWAFALIKVSLAPLATSTLQKLASLKSSMQAVIKMCEHNQTSTH